MNIIDKYPDFYAAPVAQWGKTGLALHSAPTVDGNPHDWEREALVRLIMHINASTVFEFGTFNGATAKVIGLVPCVEKVWTLDLPYDKKPSMNITPDDWRFIHYKTKVEFPTNVTQLWGDSATFDFSPITKNVIAFS